MCVVLLAAAVGPGVASAQEAGAGSQTAGSGRSGSVRSTNPPGPQVEASGDESPVSEVAAHGAVIDASKLGVSLSRIRQGLRRRAQGSTTTFDATRLRLSTYVEVAAKAPPFLLFSTQTLGDLRSRAVPYGSPTTQEMLSIMGNWKR